MRKHLLILILIATFATVVTAQNEKDDKIEAYKIAFITEKLNLTPKEASVFWPLYNEYSDKMSDLRTREHNRVKTFNQKINPTDNEADQFIKEYLAFKNQQNDLTQKYIIEFKKVIPLCKVAKLVTLEQEFKMQLLQRFKERKGPPSSGDK